MNYSTTVTGVSSRTVTRKKDGKTITIFEIVDSHDRKWTTSRRDLANEAYGLVNKAAEIEGRMEQNGSYENFYLDDIREAVASAQRPQEGIPESRQSAPEQQNITGDGEGTAKDWSIWRQCATKVSAQISQTPAEFWANVPQLVTYYATGLMPEIREELTPRQQREQESSVTSYAPAAAAQASQKNTFVPESAYNDPGRDSPVDYIDDIPFAPTSMDSFL